MNVSTQAHNQNVGHRKELEGLGYKFSLGHDGWALFFNADAIDSGRVFEKGEMALRACLDAAVLAAVKHRSANVVVIKEEPPHEIQAQLKEVKAQLAPVIVEVLELTKLQRKMIESAVKLLETAGAQYRIEAQGSTFTNMPEPVKVKARVDHAANYGPILHPLVGTGPFVAEVPVPEHLDVGNHRSIISNYLSSTYGVGTYTTETDVKARVITVLVTDAPFKED